MLPTRSTIDRLADWAATFDPAGHPAVRTAARRALIDVVGCAVAGTDHETVRRVDAHVRALFTAGGCWVAGHPPASPLAAAMVNGTAAHVLDLDDTCFEGIVHASAVIWPAVQAAGEMHGASGADVFAGFIVGIETEGALARALTRSLYDKGWWNTGLLGRIAAAAGAARVLGLDAGRTMSAIAMAMALSGGQRSILGTSAKPTACGLAARDGLEAALLAARGIEGPHLAMEDFRGFAAIANNGRLQAETLDELGSRFVLIDPGFAYKAYPACSAAQAAIEATLMLRSAQAIRPEDVAEVVCEITPLVAISLTFDRPATPTQAQFSLPYCVARALFAGRFDKEALTDSALGSEPVRALMEKVRLVRCDDMALDPRDLIDHPEAAIVTIRTHDGAHCTQEMPAATGMPVRPMADAAIEAKFLANAGPVIGETQTGALLERLRGIERLADIRDLHHR